MPLLNYWTKILTKITQTTNQGPDEQKILKTKNKGIDNTEKKICQDNFFVQKKGIYQKVEFCPKP